MQESKLIQAIVSLFQNERFYGEVIMGMSRVSAPKLGTIGVCIKDRVELHVDYEYFNTKTLAEQVALLKHEAGHILNDHIPRFKTIDPTILDKMKELPEAIIRNEKFKSMNIAADLALNCNIRDLPEGGCFPRNFDLEDGYTMEWYLEKLKNNEKMKQMMNFDPHLIWSKSDGGKEEIKAKINQLVNKAAASARAAGCMSSNDELLVDRLNHKAKDWRALVKRFAANLIETKIESSRKKRNRRYGIRLPGYTKTQEMHLGVAIDTSGSVPDTALNQFMSEIACIAKYAKVTVVEADSEVKNTYEFDPKKKYKISGRGGTAYQPAFNFFSEDKTIDGVIYFGDMDTSDKVSKPKYPVLWAVYGNQAPPADWGWRTKIEINRNGNS